MKKVQNINKNLQIGYLSTYKNQTTGEIKKQISLTIENLDFNSFYIDDKSDNGKTKNILVSKMYELTSISKVLCIPQNLYEQFKAESGISLDVCNFEFDQYNFQYCWINYEYKGTLSQFLKN